MVAESDPEKGHARRSSELERPLSRTLSHASRTTEGQDEGDDDDRSVREKHEDGDRASRHENDLYPAATLGEPSGDGIYACEETCSPCRTRSRASSMRSRPVSIVPRAKRRGLFGRFTVIPEVEKPYDYKNSTKWTITAAIALATAAAPMGSSIFYRELTDPFQASRVNSLTLVPQLLCPLSQVSSAPRQPSPTCPWLCTC